MVDGYTYAGLTTMNSYNQRLQATVISAGTVLDLSYSYGAAEHDNGNNRASLRREAEYQKQSAIVGAIVCRYAPEQ